MQHADLVVISYFADPAASMLWQERRDVCRPWAFWGERPGAHQRGWLGRLVRRYRLRHLRWSAAPVWAIGSWAATAWREEFGGDRKVENLPYFSDLARFTHAATGRQHHPSRRRLLFAGSLIGRKGVDLLLKAFASISARHPGLSLTLAGRGDLETSLREEIALKKLPAVIADFVPWEELPALYAKHDILVVPSRYDGWGMVVPEGLASGMPVLATDQMGAALDLIEDGKNGWVASAGSLESLVRCLEQALMLDEAALAAMSKAAQASVAAHQLVHGAEAFEKLSLQALDPHHG